MSILYLLHLLNSGATFFIFVQIPSFCLILYYYESLVIPMFTQSPTMMGQTLLVAVIYFSDSFHYEGHYPQSTTWEDAR
jgi:hypothetical protein